MKRVRAYRKEDREKVAALWAKHEGLAHADPDYANHILTLVVEEDGEIVAAGTGRLTVELFLVHNPKHGTPAERWDNIQKLLEHARAATRAAGLDEAHIFVPQGLSRYAERLSTIPNVLLDDRFHLILFPKSQEKSEADDGTRRIEN